MKHISKNKGFSLLEIIVVVAIIGIMAAILMPGQLKNRNKKMLSLETEQMVDNIRNARSYTFNAINFDASGGPPAGGFGIHFDENSSSYFVFGDLDNGQDYDSEEKYQIIELSNDIKIPEGGLKIIDGETTTPSSVDVVFTSPYGVTYINESNAAGRKLEITMTGSAGSETITVDTSGAIN